VGLKVNRLIKHNSLIKEAGGIYLLLATKPSFEAPTGSQVEVSEINSWITSLPRQVVPTALYFMLLMLIEIVKLNVITVGIDVVGRKYSRILELTAVLLMC